MRYILPLMLLLACNPVKQVQRDPLKTLKVVDWYLQQYPMINDTVWNTVKGEPVETTDIDTIEVYQGGPWNSAKDSFYIDRYHTITKTITKLRVDTLIRTIRDNQMLREYQRSNAGKDGEIKQLKEQVTTIGKTANKWKYRFIALCVLIGIWQGIKLYLKLKPGLKA